MKKYLAAVLVFGIGVGFFVELEHLVRQSDEIMFDYIEKLNVVDKPLLDSTKRVNDKINDVFFFFNKK